MNPAVTPFVMVIYGATGDLMSRKLMPALYNLLTQKILPDRFFIVGFARRPMTHEEFRFLMRNEIVKHSKSKTIDPAIWKRLEKNLYYQQGFFEEDAPYEKLIALLSSFDREIGACITRFFYLATPPENYSTILKKLATTKLSEGCGQGSSRWTRILIEKPFGKDMDQAKALEDQLSKTFEERQIYRIDHYLAKETIQNILAFRFANVFETIWNRDAIDHVQITLAESEGIGRRGKFYEGVGALRDVAQNHLMAMLAYVTMHQPKSFSAQDLRAERVAILSKIIPISSNNIRKNVIRGQYGELVTDERRIVSYREEKDVAKDSLTETYVALKLFLDDECWKGVPFYLRTGKRLKESNVRIDILFKQPFSKLFSGNSFSQEAHSNVLTIRVQPKEGITFRILAKTPGLVHTLEPVDMDFSYSSSFKKEISDSYEKLLVDSMMADQTLFATRSGFTATWSFITNIMKGWEETGGKDVYRYEPGTWGPREADELIRRDGRHWLLH